MCISSSRVAVRGPLQHCAHPHPNPDDVGVLILRAALPSIDGCGHMECGAARIAAGLKSNRRTPRVPGSLPRHGGSSCAAALRSSDFFSPPCKRLSRWDAARHTKRRHRVKGRDPASGRPDTEGLRRRRHTGPTDRGDRQPRRTSPSARGNAPATRDSGRTRPHRSKGRTPRPSARRDELTVVDASPGAADVHDGRPFGNANRSSQDVPGAAAGWPRHRREAGEPARSGAGNYRSWARNRPDDEPGWWDSRSCKETSATGTRPKRKMNLRCLEPTRLLARAGSRGSRASCRPRVRAGARRVRGVVLRLDAAVRCSRRRRSLRGLPLGTAARPRSPFSGGRGRHPALGAVSAGGQPWLVSLPAEGRAFIVIVRDSRQLDSQRPRPVENGYHLAPAYLLAITRSCRRAGGPWTNPELQRPPRRRRMASTRPPGTYSPSARTGRRGGGSGSVAGMVRRAGSDALPVSLRSTAPVGSSAASIRRRNRPNTAFRFRGCFDMRNPLQHNPGPRGPGRTDGDRGRRGRRRRVQAADAGSEAPTDHGRWPTGTFWPASKTPCYADRK